MTAEPLPPVAILAGGLGTRLYPVTQTIPKALVEINGTPFIDHQLRLLASQGVSHVVMCVGHLGEMIEEYVGDGSSYGLRVDYVFDGDTLLGTAGALKNALPALAETFFVLYGDSYLLGDYHAIYERFRESGKPALMTVYRNDRQWDTSNVIYQDGLVTLYDKHNPTPEMVYIDYGLTLVTASLFELLPTTEPSDLAGIYNRLSLAGDLAGFEMDQRFYEIGTQQGIQRLEDHLNAQNS